MVQANPTWQVSPSHLKSSVKRHGRHHGEGEAARLLNEARVQPGACSRPAMGFKSSRHMTMMRPKGSSFTVAPMLTLD